MPASEFPLPDRNTKTLMPTDAELKRAQRKVEAAGGKLVPGPHLASGQTHFDASPAPPETASPSEQMKAPKMQASDIPLIGCGHTAGIEIPYRDQNGRHKKMKGCLICDSLFRAPNFDGAL